MSAEEWIKFFSKTDELAAEIIGPAGTANIRRIDEAAPWSVNNIYMHNGRRTYTKRAKDAVLVRMTQSNRFGMMDADADYVPVVLTKTEWINELKSAAQT